MRTLLLLAVAAAVACVPAASADHGEDPHDPGIQGALPFYPHCPIEEVPDTPRGCLCPYPPPASILVCVIPPP